MIALAFLLLAADTGRIATTSPIAQPSSYVLPAIQERDSWLGEDKLKHFAMSYMITAGSFGAARTIADRDASITIGVALGTAAGILKEIYDNRDDRRFSIRDLLWDAAGITVGALVANQTR